MVLITKKNSALRWSSLAISFAAALAALPSVAQSNANITPRKGVAPGGMVDLNAGTAKMVQQSFALPKDTFTYSYVGLTTFPYYEASPQLKAFLNSPAATIGGQPLSQQPLSSSNGPFSLPPTDLTHFSVNIPSMPMNEKNAVKLGIVDKRRKDEVPWIVARQEGQVVGLPGDTEGMAMLSAGSMFSAVMPRTMVLRYGTMWITTGARPAGVLTKNGALQIKPYSIVAVEHTWFNRLRVASLYGPPVEMQLACQGQTSKVTIEKGQERTVYEHDLANNGSAGLAKDDSIGSDASSPVPGLSMVAGVVDKDKSSFIEGLKGLVPPFTSHKMQVDFQTMLTENGVSPEMRHDEISKEILRRQNLATRPAVNKLGHFPRPGAEIALRTPDGAEPVAFPKVAEELKVRKLGGEGEARYLASAVLETSANGHVSLKSGEAVLTANRSMIIDVNDYSIFLRPGTMVHLVAKNGLFAVKNIRETEPSSVKTRIKSHIFDCPAGSELIVATSQPDIFTEMKSDGVGRRRIRNTETEGGTVILSNCEVDLTSLMQYSPLMRKIYKSRYDSDRFLVQDIMKSIVALNTVTGAKGGYQRIAGTQAGIQ